MRSAVAGCRSRTVGDRRRHERDPGPDGQGGSVSHDAPAAAGAIGADLAEGRFQIEWGAPGDLRRGLELDRAYRDLSLGLVDGVVMAVAERLEARAIATLDLRDFGAVTLNGNPEIWPRDL